MSNSGPIVKLLEDYLKHAKDGCFSSIAISATGEEGFQSHFRGEVQAEQNQLRSVLQLADRLQASIDNWQPYAPDWSLGADYAFFHLGLAPEGFDFLTWLLVQEMLRIDAGAPAPLKVAFWAGHEPVMKNKWLDPVYRPMLKLVGAVEDNRALQRMGKEIYLTKALIDMYRLGMKLPKLRAASSYDLPRDVVTITLREADHWSHKNSDPFAWLLAAKSLRQDNRVVIVRDTAKADEPWADFETCPLASKDMDARMYLYQNAKLNLFVSNGPMMLCTLSDAPYLCFVPPEANDSKYLPNNPLFWKLKMGVEVGSQFPWATNKQRIVWQKDTDDNIKKAYEEWQAN